MYCQQIGTAVVNVSIQSNNAASTDFKNIVDMISKIDNSATSTADVKQAVKQELLNKIQNAVTSLNSQIQNQEKQIKELTDSNSKLTEENGKRKTEVDAYKKFLKSSNKDGHYKEAEWGNIAKISGSNFSLDWISDGGKHRELTMIPINNFTSKLIYAQNDVSILTFTFEDLKITGFLEITSEGDLSHWIKQ